jgi:hypothetical protein
MLIIPVGDLPAGVPLLKYARKEIVLEKFSETYILYFPVWRWDRIPPP